MATGSRHVAILIKNQTAVLIIIGKGVKVTQVVTVNKVPPVEVMPGTLEKLDEMQGIWWTRMSIEHRKYAPPVARFIRTGGMVWHQPHIHSPSVNWVPQHLGFYGPSEAWDQGCWWWALKEPLRRDFGGFPLPWWRKWGPMWRKCWKWVLSTLVKANDVMPSC